ncbi:hypothetical protein FRC17_003530 [Serendipita sp. 399]|nr:hypothetical protein FRC17_003530 [Serendipita sp. 399]
MATATKEQKDPRTVHDLVSLITSSSPLGSTSTKPITIYPNDDTLLSLLHARFRHDLPFTRLGSSSLVAVNPNKLIVLDNEKSMREIAEKSWDASGRWRKDGGLQAHAYEFATRIYLANRRFSEPQLVVPRGIAASGKSHTLDLLTRQILHLSSSPAFTFLSSTGARKSQKIASQIAAFNTLLNSFGRAKTPANPDASRYSSYTELHFSTPSEPAKGAGGIIGARILAWGLDKSRLTRLRQDERTFHIFYQLLSGASSSLYESMGLEDASEYALLASSGCYRLPSGPFSDDAAQFGIVQDAMTTLGFKDRHKEGVWRLLSAILTLGNVEFDEPLSKRDLNAGYLGGANGLGGNVVEGQEEVRILNPGMLDRAARLLGVSSEDLTNVLTVKSSYVRKEVLSTYLELAGARRQRDTLVGGLYTLLFSYVVETANHKLNPSPSSSEESSSSVPIVFLDSPGFSTRASQGAGALVSSASGGNGFTEFVTNFQDEIIQSYALRHDFDDNLPPASAIAYDGIHLPSMTIMDNSTVIELLRGGLVSSDEKSVMGKRVAGVLGVMNKAATSIRKGGYVSGEEMVQELVGTFSTTPSFIQPVTDPFASTTSFASNTQAAGLKRFSNFGINHYAGPVTYGVQDWVELDADAWDAGFVRILRNSGDGFLKRLVSGPGISSESHVKDPSVVVRAQVSSRPLRNPSLLSPTEEEEEERAYGLDPTKAYPITTQVNSVLSSLLSQLERAEARLWTVQCIRPNDSGLSNSFDKKRVRAQIRSLGIVDLVGRKQHEWVEGHSYADFLAMSGMGSGVAGGAEDGIRAVASGERWTEGVDFVLGKTKVWLSWEAWRDFDDRSRLTENGMRAISPSRGHGDEDEAHSAEGGEQSELHGWVGRGAGAAGRPSIGSMAFGASQEDLLYSRGGIGSADPNGTFPPGPPGAQPGWNGSAEWEKGSAEGYSPAALTKGGPAMEMSKSGGKNGYSNLAGGEADGSTAQIVTGLEKGGKGKTLAKPIEVVPTTRARRWWVRFVWLCTWWIPSFLLHYIGGMKRSDIRMAWREKVTICFLIFAFCGAILFYVILFGKLLCPEFDHAWNSDELLGHQADDDFFVSIQGNVYDISKFWKSDHSIPGRPMIRSEVKELAGFDLSNYFPPPLDLACAGLVGSTLLEVRISNSTDEPIIPNGIHLSGARQTLQGSDLVSTTWYVDKFLPKMKPMYKGPLVWGKKQIDGAVNRNRAIGIYRKQVYDLSDYIFTLKENNGGGGYDYINTDIVDVFRQQTGQDVTKSLDSVLEGLTERQVTANMACLKNRFFYGTTDFRETPSVSNTIFNKRKLTTVLVVLAALQLTSKRSPELLDKFIICQVPCYTEGEESLRRTIDSLAALKYDDKRKLLFIICDGNIVGSGNDRSTPRIVLDILGVDPSLDPEPLMFRSIGEGSKQLNYGKIYSGLYEFEGHVVPPRYMVVVKVGKPSERQRPGNRGKRDSQILLLHYLNRVHFDAPMSPLELEMYHQMHNIIGIDPAFYEYIFMVDADTTVTPDSLNRLVAVTSDDSRVIAVCGETKLDNEDGSWWTMIQVYEYYISHHLAKAFESLFGSVTCLPGCFSMYRIRTADKGRPLIISNRIIEEYSECNVDTLHKKNLLQLGEDRYLTTIMMKHFPLFKMKFTPDAIAHTVAPDRWSVLLSQRRRWINSTIHNLLELISLGELCGFCCFSMRFIVFVDLLGTIILPATAVYLVYLIVVVATKASPLPVVSLAMIGAVYGLQAVIFLLKREFMLIGWMIIYIIAYPVYSFFLPIYSFWSMDDFSWGNTRIVVGEGRDKKVVIQDDEGFDENAIPLKKFSDYEAEALDHGEHRSVSGDSRPDSRARSAVPAARHSRQGSQVDSGHHSPAGDYYRDTNITHNNSSNPNLRLPPIGPLASLNASAHSGSQMGVPQLPSAPFAGQGSDYGHNRMGSMVGMSMGPMGMPNAPGFGMMGGAGEFGSFGYGGSAYGGSAFGGTGGPAVPRNSVMTNLNMFGGGGGSMGSAPPSSFPGGFGQQQRPMSTFSMATSINPLMNSAPSLNPNPSDEELLNVLRIYLSTQDLMTVTKKTAREAVMARFPKADLSSKKDFLNQSIEQILSET